MNFGVLIPLQQRGLAVGVYRNEVLSVKVGLEIAVFAPSTDLGVGIIGEVDVEL